VCKTVNSIGQGVGVGVGVGVGIGVGVLVGMDGVGVDMIPLQPDKANPINTKKPIRNKPLFLSNMIPPDLKTSLVLLWTTCPLASPQPHHQPDHDGGPAEGSEASAQEHVGYRIPRLEARFWCRGRSGPCRRLWPG
jgi:hypothetical protein